MSVGGVNFTVSNLVHPVLTIGHHYPMAFFFFLVFSIFPVELFNYHNGKIFNGGSDPTGWSAWPLVSQFVDGWYPIGVLLSVFGVHSPFLCCAGWNINYIADLTVCGGFDTEPFASGCGRKHIVPFFFICVHFCKVVVDTGYSPPIVSFVCPYAALIKRSLRLGVRW